MTRLGTIPIYFPTEDKRIQEYLNKNIAHHQLHVKPESNGNIRAWVKDTLTAILFVGVIYALFVLSAAFEVTL